MILGQGTKSVQKASTITGFRLGQLCLCSQGRSPGISPLQTSALGVTAGFHSECSQLRLSSALHSSSHPHTTCRKQGRQGRPCTPSIKTEVLVTEGHCYKFTLWRDRSGVGWGVRSGLRAIPLTSSFSLCREPTIKTRTLKVPACSEHWCTWKVGMRVQDHPWLQRSSLSQSNYRWEENHHMCLGKGAGSEGTFRFHPPASPVHRSSQQQ